MGMAGSLMTTGGAVHGRPGARGTRLEVRRDLHAYLSGRGPPDETG